MVEFISQYDILVEFIHDSNCYKNAQIKEKQKIDSWLNKPNVKDYFGKRIIPQLTFHESFVFSFLNSKEFQQRTSEKQQNIRAYLDSKKVKNYLGKLEKRLSI